MNEILLKFTKFCIVGGSGVFVDLSITYLCKEKLKWNKYLSSSLAFIVAASSNYFLNRIYTFNSDNQNITTEYFSFVLVSSVGLLINNLTIWTIHDKFKNNFYFSKIIAIGVATLWNFIANYAFTFSSLH
jgi:putative flippase GtrA